MLSSLIPNPLHPAIVHLPVALVVFLPAVMLIALWAIRRGTKPLMAWGAAVAVHAMLAATAWLALATGDPAKEQVERTVAEAPIESHEEAAEAFLALTAAALAVSLIGVRRDAVGKWARVTAAAGSVVLLGAGWNVGHSGGQLVYKYGAGTAYANASGGVTASDRASHEQSDDER